MTCHCEGKCQIRPKCWNLPCCSEIRGATSIAPGGYVLKVWDGVQGGNFTPYDEGRLGYLAGLIMSALDELADEDIAGQHMALANIYRAEGLRALEVMELSNALNCVGAVAAYVDNDPASEIRKRLVATLEELGFTKFMEH
jgi:hypothetical protein